MSGAWGLDHEGETDRSSASRPTSNGPQLPGLLAGRKKIAFGGTAGADPGTHTHTVNAKTGGDLHTLTSCAGFGEGCFNDMPVWEPDGTKTTFIHADDWDVVADAL